MSASFRQGGQGERQFSLQITVGGTRFSPTKDRNPVLVVRAQNSCFDGRRATVPVGSQPLVVSLSLTKDPAAVVFYAALFAETDSDLCGATLRCDHCIARAAWTLAEMTDDSAPVILWTMSENRAHQKKAEMRIRCLDYKISSKQLDSVGVLKASVAKLTDALFDRCSAANAYFKDHSGWQTPELSRFNTSYIEHQCMPDDKGRVLRYVPHWALLHHLVRDAGNRNQSLPFYEHAITEICRRHNLTVDGWLAKSSVDKLLTAEILLGVIGFYPHGIPYLHDVVDVDDGTSDGMDEYSIPRCTPDPGASGDDCESLAMEMIRCWHEIHDLQIPAEHKSDSAARQGLRHLQFLVRRVYIMFQVTGAIRGNSEPPGPGTTRRKTAQDLLCHSWIMAVRRDQVQAMLGDRTSSSHVSETKSRQQTALDRREPTSQGESEVEITTETKLGGQEERSSSSFSYPAIINGEATDPITGTEYKLPADKELKRSAFSEAFLQCKTNAAFRYTMPATTRNACDRYVYVVSLVSVQLRAAGLSTAAELVAVDRTSGKKGVDFHQMFTAEPSKTIQLVPVLQLTADDDKLAHQLSDHLWPVTSLPFTSESDQKHQNRRPSTIHPSSVVLCTRERDWNEGDQRKTFDQWCKRHQLTYTTEKRKLIDGASFVEISVGSGSTTSSEII